MADVEKERKAIEALRAFLRGKTLGQLLRALREKWGGSRKEFANYVAKRVPGADTGRVWTEDTVKHLEIGKTPFRQAHLDDLISVGIFQLMLYSEVWIEAFNEALKAQTASVPPPKPPEQPEQSGQPQPADLSKAPLEPKIRMGGGQSQEVKMPYETPSDKPKDVQRKESYQGTKPVKPRLARYLPWLVVALAVLLMGGSCAVGYVLHQYLVGNKTPTPGPATEVPTQKEVTITATPKPETATKVVSPTPEPPTNTLRPAETPRPTDTPRPTNTPTFTPTVISLPFEDNFDKGARPEWEVVSGKWRMVDGAYWADPSGSWSLTLVGDENWKDYAVDVDVDYYDWSTPDVRIIVRAVGNSYMVFQTGCCYSLWLLVSDGRAGEIAKTDEGGLRAGLAGSSHIRVEIKGNLYTAYSGGIKLLTVQDDTLTSGKAGLSVANDSYRWRRFDNFKVSALER